MKNCSVHNIILSDTPEPLTEKTTASSFRTKAQGAQVLSHNQTAHRHLVKNKKAQVRETTPLQRIG